MEPRQEFLLIKSGDEVAVYAPRQYPLERPIGRDDQRLGITGPTLVQPPKIHWTTAEFDQWRQQLEEAGYTVTVGPFWRNPKTLEEALRSGRTYSLEEFRDELLRGASGARSEGDRQLEPLKPTAR